MSAITASKNAERNTINWTYCAIWYINYKAFFKHCTLQIILHCFYCLYLHTPNSTKKLFALKTEPYFIFFDLVWVGIQCYSVKGSVLLVLFVQGYRESGILYLQQIWFLGNSNKKSPLWNVHQYIFPTFCNTFHSNKSKNPTYDIDYRRDASLYLRVWKKIIQRKMMAEKNVK